MEDKMIDKNALTEVYTILTQLDLYSKIPKEFQEYIIENKNNDYIFSFNKNMPLFTQVTNSITRMLLSYIYIKYINTSANENKFLLNEVLELLNVIK